MFTPHISRRILVPLDGSDLGTVTFPHLRALACVESTILLLRVIPPDPLVGAQAPDVATPSMTDSRIRAMNSCRAYLHTVAHALRDVTPHVEALVRLGPPADTVLKVAGECKVDLILMPTHGRGALGRLALGSVANRVAQAASVPVMLIHAQYGALPLTADAIARYRRIVVPLDGSERARTALSVAVELARQHNLPVHVVRAVPSREEFFASFGRVDATPHYRRPVCATPRNPDSDQEDTYYKGYITALSDAITSEAVRLRQSGVDAIGEILVGPAAPAIRNVISPGDLIVMSSHGEGGVRQWLMGSVAERLVVTVEAPVILVPVAERQELTQQRGTDAKVAPESPAASLVQHGSGQRGSQ